MVAFTLAATKIFITGGEHDLVDNIIHLVFSQITRCACRLKRHQLVPGA